MLVGQLKRSIASAVVGGRDGVVLDVLRRRGLLAAVTQYEGQVSLRYSHDLVENCLHLGAHFTLGLTRRPPVYTWVISSAWWLAAG